MQTYDVSLSPEDVRARLEAMTHRLTLGDNMLKQRPDGRPVVGAVETDRFWWQVPHQGKHFAPWIEGRISPGPRGSTVAIDEHSALSRKVQVVLLVVLLAVAIAGTFLAPPRDMPELAVRIVGVLAVLLIPLGVVRLYADEPRRLRKHFEVLFANELERK